MRCPEIEALQDRSWNAETRAHVAACGSCKLVMELIDERSQAAESRERRVECAKFEALIAVRVGAELAGAAHTMLEEHLRDCADCRALAQTMAPVGDPPDHATLPAIEPSAYALGSEVARGGMGRIIAARDLRIGRPVAVKELLAKNAGLAARFEREARVTARLQHPGIVPIYEIGRWESGTPFYAMRMVEGKTLRAALQERTTPAARLALLPSVIAAAEAVAFAHAHDVIHRDLTPSNILVGEYGETVVIDWGLAKDLSETTDDADVGPYRRDPSASADLTAAGAVIGTASYMPPEQAAGERVDARADVYALGAILYHLLAGTAPYRGTLEDVLRSVKAEPPKPLPATTPRDLASIVSKAMAREPADRYPSARELAGELTAFQAGRLVGAHEYTRGELVRRFVRRNRGVLGAVAIATMVLAVVGTISVRRVFSERDEAKLQRTLAVEERAQSEGLSLTLLAEQGRQELLAGHATRALPYLSAAYSRGDTSSDTRFMIAAAMHSIDAREHVFDTSSRTTADLAFSNDGEQILAVEGNAVIVWNLATGGSKTMLLAPEEVLLTEAVFSPDGKTIAAIAGDQQNRWPAIYVFDVASSKRRDFVGHTHSSTRPLFSPDGKYLHTISWDSTWRRWELATGDVRVVKTYGPPRYGRRGLVAGAPALDRAGERLLTMNWQGMLELWDVATGNRLWNLPSQPTWGVSLHPDGKRVLACNIEEAILWDITTNKVIARRKVPHFHLVHCSFRPDGKAILLASDRTEFSVWDDQLDRQLANFLDDGGLNIPMFGDLDHLVVSSAFGSVGVTVWDYALETRVAHIEDAGSVVAASADGRRVAVTRLNGGVEVWRLDRTQLRRRFATDGSKTVNVSLDGARVAAESTTGLVHIHDVDRNGEVLPAPSLRPPFDIAGHHVAAGTPEGDVVIVDGTGAQIVRFAPPGPPINLELTEDGTRLLVSDAKGAEIRAAQTGRVLATIPVAGRVSRLSADGSTVAVLGEQILLWDVAGARERSRIPLAGRVLFDFVILSRDGSRVAVPYLKRIDNEDRITFHLYDDAGKPLAELPQTIFPAFSARTDRIYAMGTDGAVHVLRFSDGKELRRLPIEPRFGIVQVTADGTRLLLATANGICEVRSAIDGRLLHRFVARPAVPQINVETRDIGYSFTIANGFNGIRDDLFVAGNENGSAIATWDIHLETRSPAEIERLVDERVAWKLENGRLVRRDPAVAR